MGTMCVMDVSGDSKTIWDPENSDEVENAKRTFDGLKRKGYTAYRVRDDGKKAEIMREFDPNAGKVILSPAMAGG